MFTVDLYAQIRLAHRDGLGIRALAKKFNCSRQFVRKALLHAEPPGYQQTQPRPCPAVDSFKPIIDQILQDDQDAPPKQRHTVTQIFQRLQDEHGYPGSYSPICRYVRSQQQAKQETFIPLSHTPGSRLECDFGQIYVDFPEGRRPVSVLLATWAYSHFPFAIALPSQKTEAILEGMVQAFDFFECVPREVWWDNPTTVASAMLQGRQRRLHPRYQALASHYNFEPLFCMPARGNEKPHVENRVKHLQRRWATPVPHMADLAQLNYHLRQCCEQERDRTVQRTDATIGERFEQEQQVASDLPLRAFDPCVIRSGSVDKYQTVRYETNWYSVPRSLAFQKVTLKGYVDRICVVFREKVVAVHQRCYEQHAQVLDPLHYLITLGQKPATLDHSEVYRNWKLPAFFAVLREALEERHGKQTGARQYVRVLQLLAEHPASRVRCAIETCLARGQLDARLIIQSTVRLAESVAHASKSLPTPEEETPAHQSNLETEKKALGSLSHFDQLLSKGASSDA